MLPQLFAAAAEKLSFKSREVGPVTLANAHQLSPYSLNLVSVPKDFGQLTGALEEYQKSLALRHRLVRIDPTNAQWRYDEACILDRMGYEYRKAGLTDEAIAAYEVSASIWRQLAKTDPRNRRLDLSVSLGKLGAAKLAVSDSVGATAAYEESAVNWRRLLKRDPDDPVLRINLVDSLEKIGALKFKAGDNTGALVAYREVVAIYRWLDEIDGSNTERQWNLSLSLDRIGDVELALGHTNGATSAYEESLALRRHLVEVDTSNSQWHDGVSSSLRKISDLKHVVEERAAKLAAQKELQDIERLLSEIDRVNAKLRRKLFPSTAEGKETANVSTRSLATIEEWLTVCRGLATSDPTCAKYQCDLLADLDELAHGKMRHGDPVGALSAYEGGLAIRRRFADTDQTNTEFQRALCITLGKLGDLRQAESNHAAAIALYEASLCIRRRLVAQDNGYIADAPDAARSPTPWTNPKESDVQRKRRAIARDQWDLVLTLEKVAYVRRNTCDNSRARAALEESLATARQLLEENKTFCINAALHSLACSLGKIEAVLRHRFGRCRNKASALLEKFSVSALAAQGSHRAVKTVKLAIKRTVRRCRNEAFALQDKFSARAWAAAQVSRRTVKTVRLVTKRPLRRYRNEASALLDKISARLQASAQGSQHAAKTVTLVIKQLTLDTGCPRKREPTCQGRATD
jgi:tetratricopeptide (TPR) repeat protein